MKGRKQEERAERKHGGAVPKKADGNPEVIKEAEKGKSVGKIGGVKGSPRLDRRHGGACRKNGGGAGSDTSPYSSAGRALRACGGKTHH